MDPAKNLHDFKSLDHQIRGCIPNSVRMSTTYQIIFKNCIQKVFAREIEHYRKQKKDHEIFVDDEYKRVYVFGTEIELQELPYRILIYLMENRGAPRSAIKLYSDVWNDPNAWKIAENNPKLLQDRVKARIYLLRKALQLPTIKISYCNKRYSLSTPYESNYCLVKKI